MDPLTLPPDPTHPPTPAPPPIVGSPVEALAAQRTGDAIKAGVDPHEATAQLGRTVGFLRDHPDAAGAANLSLQKGTDPKMVMLKLGMYVSQAGAPTPKPGVDVGKTTLATYPSPKPTTPTTPVPQASSLLDKIAETLSSGLPGGRSVLAAGDALPDLLKGKGWAAAKQDFNTSLDRQQQDVSSMPVAAQVPLKMLGGVPLAAAVSPLGLVGGGAVFGAAQGADAPANTAGERLARTGFGAVTGAAGGAIFKGAGNLATRTGLTDKVAGAVSGLLEKIGVSPATAEDAMSNIGTRGQVTPAMATRQDLLSKVGDVGETAAKQQQDQMATFKAQTDANYNLARQDKAVVQDPRLNELLQDKDIAPIMKKVSAIRESQGNPLPTVASPAQVPLALQKMGVSPERYAELQAVGQQRRVPISGTDILPPELMGDQATGVEVPDPEAIHSLKRYLNESVDRGMDSKLEITRDQARALLPKAQAITARFHELSPDWAAADQFHAAGKGEEEAYNAGVDAFRNAANPSAENMATDSPEALQKAITTPRYPSEPPEAIAGRYAAFQRGMRASAGDVIRDSKVTDQRMSDALSSPAFANTEKGSQMRSLMVDDPAQQDALEETIANLTGTKKDVGSTYNRPIINKFSALSAVARKLQKPDMLNTPAGQLLVNQLSRNPDLLQQTLSASKGVGTIPPNILKMLGIDASGQATRALFGSGRSVR